jgi:hypothetical protein
MSHVAVILTSERCGHCRNMRGNGRLLTKGDIKRENKQPNIPGGNYYDANFMRKLITCELGKEAKLRVINLHYKTFNPGEGFMDISVFTLESDGNIKQTMLKENAGKTNVVTYLIGETGKVLSNNDIDTPWNEISKTYVPVNIANYAFFFPSLVLFESTEWSESIRTGAPIYGYLNGFETKEEAPYGARAGGQPNVLDFTKFLAQFFDGTKQLKGKPAGTVPVPVAPVPQPEPVRVATTGSALAPTQVATTGSRKFRLYVVEK